jgi:putative hemolysin
VARLDTWLIVLLILICLTLSAFFSGSETTFFTLQNVRVQNWVVRGIPRAKRIAHIKEHPDRFLATILLGSNVVNTALATLTTMLAIRALGEGGAALAVATALATVGLVILGEATPKTVAARHAERLAFWLVRPVELAETVLYPLAILLHKIASFLSLAFGRGEKKAASVSEEELQTIVQIGEKEGTVQKTQAEIIHKTLGLGDTLASQIMTPRTEIQWLEKGATLADFYTAYRETAHTKFPVYADEPDNIIGILYAKDVLREVAKQGLKETDDVTRLARPAHLFPENKYADDLFVEMRNQKTQMAILVSEYGSIAGILTLKQIVGAIVGRITEEPEGDASIEKIDEKTTEVDGGLRIEEANEHLKLGIPEGDYETLAGFVLDRLGRIPKEGEQVVYDGVRLIVGEMSGVKIERILVSKA